jgi:endonuclease/exonuclease/phosphatase family metal-dependent hydrolase
MPVRVCKGFGWASVLVVAMLMAFAIPAAAQTVSLRAWDATLRGGAYDDMNFGGGDLETKASTDPSALRRALLKFDTHNTIPAGSPINSSTLTLTVRTGNAAVRHLAVYCVPTSFDEYQTTWRLRKGTLYWNTPGGDLGHQHGVVTVTNVAGSKVTIDVTAITREAMQTSSRYTRLMLVDIDSTSTASWTAYYSNQAGSSTVRPLLVVNYGSTVTQTPTPTPDPEPAPPTTTTSLRVLQWNIQQGHATNGSLNLDRVVDWVYKMKPDVISFNEIMHYASSTSDHVKIIADKLKARTGQTWYYKWVQKWGASSGEGEAVMSRFPFASTASNLLDCNRAVAEGMVLVNGRTINVFSTHLDYNTSWSSTCRLAEIRELKPWAATFAQQRIIMGDFNAWPQLTEIYEMTKDYRDAWAQAVAANTDIAYPDNPDGNTRKNRIDYVFYSTGATALVLKSAQVYDTRDSSGVKPSDHNPLVATFEVR